MAVLAGGVAAAVAVPLDRPGVGWLVAGTVIAVAVAVVVRRTAPAANLGQRAAAGLGALALLGIGTVRAAGWLVTLCVLAALLLSAVAGSPGRTWRTLGFAPLAVAHGAVAGLGWVRRVVASLPAGGSGGARTFRRPVAVGLVTGLVLLVFGGLLASADTVFADLLGQMIPDFSVATLLRGFFLLAAGSAVTAGLAYAICFPHRIGQDELAHRRVPPWEWGPPLAALDVLFAIFVWVQLGTMFGWHDYVQAPDGPDYAEYARAGLGQLLLVTLLTFVVIAIVAHFASRQTARDRLWLRALVGVLCVLSVVIVASAVNRLWLYQDAYGLTRTRLLAAVGEVWLGVMFLLVMAAGLTLSGGWLARAVVGTAAATLFVVAAANPDAVIANWNVDRALTGRELAYGYPVDRLDYVGTLSADAITAIDRLPEPRRSCLLARVADEIDSYDPWYAFNVGRERARAVLAHRMEPLPDCTRSDG